MTATLEQDYGAQNYANMFFEEGNVSRARSVFYSPQNLSWGLMKRKLSIKVLRAVLGDDQVRFVWATGGHSAAAAHGDFFNQSYTAVMEQQAKAVFGAVGIDLEGRNYAVGGSNSGPEIAFCSQEMFGFDIDVISWDFGMTDGDRDHLQELYFYRAAMGRNRPAAVAFRCNPLVIGDLEERGMVAFHFDEKVLNQVINQIPDTFGKNQQEIDDMPPYVRAFRCDKLIEEGDPYCGDQKFDNSICDWRRFRVSWHPGWKWHALNGNLMANFLVELLGDAIDDVMASENPKAFLKELELAEKADYDRLRQSDMPRAEAFGAPEDEDTAKKVRSLYYKGHNICHLALLPSQIRYMGILTESGPVSIEDTQGGLLMGEARKTPNEGETLRLVGEDEQRQVCAEALLNIDHYDFFYLSQSEGWKQIIVPNRRELEYYGDGNDFVGQIAICYVNCPWNTCPDHNFFGGINDGKEEITVNDVQVKSQINIGMGCFLLLNEAGTTWNPNSDGQYLFRMRVNETDTYLRYSSFIFW